MGPLLSIARITADALDQFERFGWEPAKSRGGGVKAVGTGELLELVSRLESGQTRAADRSPDCMNLHESA